jgi:hypothetical protein
MKEEFRYKCDKCLIPVVDEFYCPKCLTELKRQKQKQEQKPRSKIEGAKLIHKAMFG